MRYPRVFRVNLDANGEVQPATFKMRRIDNFEEHGYFLGIRQKMEYDGSVYHLHAIAAIWQGEEDIFYIRVSPDGNGPTSVMIEKISGHHGKSIGIEAAWIGAFITGQIESLTGYQAFWVGSKQKFKYSNQ